MYFCYCRVRGLLKTGALKRSEQPLWYDVFEAFPPQVEPLYDRPSIDRMPINLLYKEDVIRAFVYIYFVLFFYVHYPITCIIITRR